jgi:hypothetical protein
MLRKRIPGGVRRDVFAGADARPAGLEDEIGKEIGDEIEGVIRDS